MLLLFALVLGLSAVVASIAPPPEASNNERAPEPTVAAPPPRPAARSDLTPPITFRVQPRGKRPPTRRVEAGSSFSLDVRVRQPGDVVIEDLGLRQTADPVSPAHFDLLASPAGRHAIDFAPVTGGRRVVGQLVFAEPETVTRRPRVR